MNVKLNNGTIGLEHIQKSNKNKPEWKVISLQTENYTFNLHLNSMYKSGDVEFSLEHLLNVQKAKIITVQRLSDGEVFSVGDNTNNGIISAFKLDKSPAILERSGMLWVNVENNISDFNFEFIQKAKQPLFTTEDGAQIYDGDEVWFCNNEFKVGSFIIKQLWHSHNEMAYKFFSTHSAANEYALANKPQLSLSDVEQAYVGDKKSKEYISLIDNLRLIIRQKK